jgi:hypothetical protein
MNQMPSVFVSVQHGLKIKNVNLLWFINFKVVYFNQNKNIRVLMLLLGMEIMHHLNMIYENLL